MPICGLGRPDSASKISPGDHRTICDWLFVGLAGAGKTSLVRQMMHVAKPGSNKPATEVKVFQTLGIDVTDIKYKKRMYMLREIGGAMQNLWPKFLVDCKAIVFVVDSSNAETHNEVRDHIKGIISSPELKFVPIILVLNKCDLVEKAEGEGGSASAFGARIKEIEESLGVAELRATYGSRLETLATSMKEVAGAKRLLDLAASYRRGAPVQRPSSAAPSATASTSRPASAGREKGTGTLASDSRAPSGDGKVEASHTRKSGSEKQGGRVDSHSRQNHAAEGVDGTALGSRDTADPNIPP